jgi:hypothetical protein
MVSGRELVPGGIFASDQHKPSIRYEEPEQADNKSLVSGSRARADNKPLALDLGAGLPVALPGPKVMEIDEDPSARSDPLLD